MKEDDGGGLEAEKLPEEVVEVLNKVNLKVEHFDINTDDDDSSEIIKKKEDKLIKKMKGKLNPSSGGPTAQMLEKCFKFDDDDKDGSFYMAEKPTSELKKMYTEKLASILVKGNFTITDEDED